MKQLTVRTPSDQVDSLLTEARRLNLEVRETRRYVLIRVTPHGDLPEEFQRRVEQLPTGSYELDEYIGPGGGMGVAAHIRRGWR